MVRKFTAFKRARKRHIESAGRLDIRFFQICVILVTAHVLVGSSIAHGDANEEARRVYGSVMSPFCPGRLLSDCPSEQATRLKDQILDDLNSGKTSKEVLNQLEGRFGPAVRAMPTGAGMGLVAWVVPPIFFIIALAAGSLWLSRRRTEIDDSDRSHPPQ